MFTFLKRKRRLILLLVLTILLPTMIISYSYVKNISLKEYIGDKRNIQKRDNNSSIAEIKEVSPLVNNEMQIFTSKDTVITKRYIYSLCNHIQSLEEDITYNDIGLSRQEFSDKYLNWDIKIFNAKNIVMESTLEGYCPNHYILQELDGYIVIYQPSLDGSLNIVKKTDIPFEYLSQELKEQLSSGLVIETLEEIEQIIEDMES